MERGLNQLNLCCLLKCREKYLRSSLTLIKSKLWRRCLFHHLLVFLTSCSHWLSFLKEHFLAIIIFTEPTSLDLASLLRRDSSKKWISAARAAGTATMPQVSSHSA